jgi:hypothetical protein
MTTQNPQKRRSLSWIVVVILAVVLAALVTRSKIGVGTPTVSAAMSEAKLSEARGNLAVLASKAAKHFQSTGTLCASASKTVPDDLAAVKGKAYTSWPTEWSIDAEQKKGFACLEFALPTAQYFQYSYQATDAGFTLQARGDLDGNGKASLFELRGTVDGKEVKLAPLKEENPLE